MKTRGPAVRHAMRLLALLLLAALALQLFFVLRIATMAVIDPASTSFQRSEAWRLLLAQRIGRWDHDWTDYTQLPNTLKRAVVASEDAGFTDHGGIDWDSIEKAWERNQKAEARAELQNKRNPARAPTAKIRGGSTITQQLAKNLFLSGERTLLRKAQELVLTLALETLLSKQRILEIYLNQVEWGEGIFGARAAATRYFKADVSRLSAEQSARLAVMLPAPKRFEARPGSSYIAGRAATIVARMPAVELP